MPMARAYLPESTSSCNYCHQLGIQGFIKVRLNICELNLIPLSTASLQKFIGDILPSKNCCCWLINRLVFLSLNKRYSTLFDCHCFFSLLAEKYLETFLLPSSFSPLLFNTPNLQAVDRR